MRTHCWTGRLEHAESRFGAYSPQWFLAYTGPSMTCMAWEDHKGPHRWVRDSRIVLRILPQPLAAPEPEPADGTGKE